MSRFCNVNKKLNPTEASHAERLVDPVTGFIRCLGLFCMHLYAIIAIVDETTKCVVMNCL